MSIKASRTIVKRNKQGNVLSSRPSALYRGFSLRSSGSGYRHIYYGETLLKAGLRTVKEAKRECDKLAHIVEGIA